MSKRTFSRSQRRYTAMSFFVAGHRSSRFAAWRVSLFTRRAISRRFGFGMRSGVVPHTRAVTYGSRCWPRLPYASIALRIRAGLGILRHLGYAVGVFISRRAHVSPVPAPSVQAV